MIIVCVLRSGGGVFTPEYVEALHEGVLSHAPDGIELVCLSDVPVSCTQIELMTDLPGFWAKMELFRPGLFTDRRVLYLDLDTVVVGDLSGFDIDLAERTLVLSDFYDPANMASGVMTWFGDNLRFVWEAFSRDPDGIVRRHPRRMDHFLRELLNREPRIQNYFPGQVVSYKEHLRGRKEPYREIVIPEEARLVCMHGRPTLTDLPEDDPVRKEWGR